MLPITPEAGRSGPASLSSYVAILRRRKWLAITVFGITLALTAVFTLRQAPIYQASTTVAVETRVAANPLDSNNSVDPSRNLQNEIEYIGSDRMDAALEKKLPDRASVSVTADEGADVLEILATSTDQDLVAKTANAVAEEYIRLRITAAVESNESKIDEVNAILADLGTQITAINAQTDELNAQIETTPPGGLRDALIENRTRIQSTNQPTLEALVGEQSLNRERLATLRLSSQTLRDGAIEVLQKAETPGEPVGPSLIRNMLIAAIVGLILAAGAVALAEHLDNTIKTKEDLEQFDVPVIGVIAGVADWRDTRKTMLESLDRPGSSASESYRALRTSVRFLTSQSSIRIIQVTSPMAAEGKSTTVANLGVVLARAGERVLVIDGDLRRPRLERFLGVDPEIGLTTALLGEVSPADAVRPVPGIPGLFVLATGIIPPNPSELLGWARTRELIEGLAERFSLVLIDSPPVLPVTDALVTARFCDATMVVVRSGQSNRRSLDRCLDNLALIEANVIGTVLNGLTSTNENYLDSYYGASAEAVSRV